MNRCLYDACDARSLRDEILDLKDEADLVVIELMAHDAAAQLLIREMIEDSPSTVAHSVHKRILFKAGLLFVVRLAPPGAASSDAPPP